MNDPLKSYELHESHFDQYAKGGERENIAQSWFKDGSIAHAQARMRDSISDPILESYPGAQWLTVGDGRFGSDAHYIESKGGRVVATDISDALLKEGAEMGYIREYRKENAEGLSFGDDSFDFVLCKESYHHFPRPMKALYEMLRVARKGVILLEPVDHYIYSNFVQALFRNVLEGLNGLGIFKLLLGREVKRHTYEEVGNYVYKVSEREMEKVALGLNYPCVAFRPVNILFSEKLSNAPAKGFSKEKLMTGLIKGTLDLLTRLRITTPQSMAVVIWKETPNAECLAGLKKSGYRVVRLPRNPYW